MTNQYLTLRADELEPGDLWLANESDHIRVDSVTPTDDIVDGVRIFGAIVHGHDRSPKVQSWTKLASEGMEVMRRERA